MQYFLAAQPPVFMEVFIFLSRPDPSNSRVAFSTDGSSQPDRIVQIFAASLSSSTSGSKAYLHFSLHDPTSGESGRQQQLTTRLSSCILDMCAYEAYLNTNFPGKFNKLQTILNNWSAKRLTLLGKITILKPLMISQMVYLLSSLPTSQKALQAVNTMLHHFVRERR